MDYLLFIEVLIFVAFSAVYSGLNISLMTLDINELRRLHKLGNKEASRVLPYREKTHLSLLVS